MCLSHAGTFPCSGSQDWQHQWCLVCRVLLHLLPKVKCDHRRLLLPPVFGAIPVLSFASLAGDHFANVSVPVKAPPLRWSKWLKDRKGCGTTWERHDSPWTSTAMFLYSAKNWPRLKEKGRFRWIPLKSEQWWAGLLVLQVILKPADCHRRQLEPPTMKLLW